MLTSENCSDTCFGVWPKSTLLKDGRVKVLEFSIGPKKNLHKNNIMNLIRTTKSLFQRCGGLYLL